MRAKIQLLPKSAKCFNLIFAEIRKMFLSVFAEIRKMLHGFS